MATGFIALLAYGFSFSSENGRHTRTNAQRQRATVHLKQPVHHSHSPITILKLRRESETELALECEWLRSGAQQNVLADVVGRRMR